MSFTLYEHGAFVLKIKHVYLKNGTYWYKRRIPSDLARYYPGNKGFLRFSLKTKNPTEAAKKAHQEALQQDAYWQGVRSGEVTTGPQVDHAAKEVLRTFDLNPGDRREYARVGITPDDFLYRLDYISGASDPELEYLPANEAERERNRRRDHNLPPEYRRAFELYEDSRTTLFLTQALSDFQKMKGENPDGKGGKLRQTRVNEFISIFGDLPIDQYTRDHVNNYIQHLLKKGNSSTTIKRHLNTISGVFSLMASERKLKGGNVFEKPLIPNLGKDSKERQPFTLAEIRKIQTACVDKDDDVRWAIALISDTGMRVSEAVGLLSEDVVLDCPVPYIKLRYNEARRLKNKGSERTIPLVGKALWAADRARNASQGVYLFPRYVDETGGIPQAKGTHASNTMNKWIEGQGVTKTCHSFRHSVHDRLREVETPQDMRKVICGWSDGSVAEGYGQGYSLDLKAKCSIPEGSMAVS